MTALDIAEKEYHEHIRSQIIQRLGTEEDYMIARGWLKERTIVPRRKHEYWESKPMEGVTTSTWPK